MDKIKTILKNLECDLVERGDYYHVKAKYRGGDNPTAIRVYKNSGVWKDFVSGTQYLPFRALVSKILNTKDKNIIDKYCENLESNDASIDLSLDSYRKNIEINKIFDDSILDNLYKEYDFYLKRNISKKTLELYKGGVGKKNNFKNFFVFPIYNQFGKIHGFSGRNLRYNKDNKKSIKWMHTKDVVNFIYPAFLSDIFLKSIIEKRSVRLVESIGDSLALSENNIFNQAVCFTTYINSKLLCYLASLNLEKIIISFNNDCNSKVNSGLVKSIVNLVKASEIIPIEKIYIQLPTDGDFGDMQERREGFFNFKNTDNLGIENKKYILSLLRDKEIIRQSHLKTEEVKETISKIKYQINDPFITK